MLLEKLWDGMGQTIPFACQDWTSTKAAYRFLSNHRISEHDIPSGHFHASAERVKAPDGPVLVLQDTTTFSYQRERPELIGIWARRHCAREKTAPFREINSGNAGS